MILLMQGITCSGKSTLAKAISEKLNIDLIEKDILIDKIIEKFPGRKECSRFCENLIFDEIERYNKANKHLVIDTTLGKDRLFKPIKKICNETNTRMLIINCFCSNKEIWEQRVRTKPGSILNNDPQLARIIFSTWKKIEHKHSISIDTSLPFEDNFKILRDWFLKHIN